MRDYLKRILCITIALCLVGYLIPERPVQASGWTFNGSNSIIISNGGTLNSNSLILNGDNLYVTAGSNLSAGSITGFTTNGGSCTTPFAIVPGSKVTFTGNYDSEIWVAGNCSSTITSIQIAATGNSWSVAFSTVSGATLTLDGTPGTASGASDTNPTTTAPTVTTSFAGDYYVATYGPTHSITSTATAGWACNCGQFSPNGRVTSNAVAAGTQGTQWNSNGTGAFTASIAAFKSASAGGGGFPVVIKYQIPRYRIPMDDRRHKLEIVTI